MDPQSPQKKTDPDPLPPWIEDAQFSSCGGPKNRIVAALGPDDEIFVQPDATAEELRGVVVGLLLDTGIPLPKKDERSQLIALLLGFVGIPSAGDQDDYYRDAAKRVDKFLADRKQAET